VKISDDIMGHQWAAALKNIYAILINASSAFSFATQENFNAAIFHAIHRELSELIARVGGDKDTAFSLSGLGDIWVTCRKGRNGKFGHHWGTAPLTPLQVNSAIFNHTTVEGYMLAMNIAPLWIGTAHLAQFPIISHTITALSHNQGYALLHQKLASYI
jgi:glycerol-3-phosphate dehydrogenase (NAD(P)+)